MLTYKEVTLRKLSLADSHTIAQLINNKNVLDNLRDYIPNPYSESDACEFIKLVENEKLTITFGIEIDKQLCGVIALVRQSDVYRLSAEIGYWIGEPYWNKGIATKAVTLIMEYGFNNLNLIRIQAGIFEYNKSSMRVLEKCGFTKEGVFQKAISKGDRVWDEHRYAIIDMNYS